MNRWLASAIALVSGLIGGVVFYHLVGLIVFGLSAVLGYDDALWQAMQQDSPAVNVGIYLVYIVGAVLCAWVAWRFVSRRAT